MSDDTPLIDRGVPILEISLSGGTAGIVLNNMNVLQLPINCVLMGHQEPISKLMELNKINGPLKGIFGE